MHHDDSGRIFIDSEKVLDNEIVADDLVRVQLTGGNHTIVVEMDEHWGASAAILSWVLLETPTNTPTATPPSSYAGYLPFVER